MNKTVLGVQQFVWSRECDKISQTRRDIVCWQLGSKGYEQIGNFILIEYVLDTPDCNNIVIENREMEKDK